MIVARIMAERMNRDPEPPAQSAPPATVNEAVILARTDREAMVEALCMARKELCSLSEIISEGGEYFADDRAENDCKYCHALFDGQAAIDAIDAALAKVATP